VTTVTDLYRYPVKSMQGVATDTVELGAAGFAGDRRWALVDVNTGRLMSAKRWSALLQASADDDAITLPDGSRLEVGGPETDAALSGWLGRDVRLVEAGDDEALAYEMTFDPPDDDAEYYAIDVPTGSLVDLAAAHLVALPTLRGAAERYGDLDWDVRRFRPNLVVDGDLAPFDEDGWVGRTLRVGSAELAARQPTVRCAMPLRGQPGLDRQPGLYAALDELHANHLGLYLDVVTPGRISVGDEVLVG
jgi:uncharacterized protein YcbX